MPTTLVTLFFLRRYFIFFILYDAVREALIPTDGEPTIPGSSIKQKTHTQGEI